MFLRTDYVRLHGNLTVTVTSPEKTTTFSILPLSFFSSEDLEFKGEKKSVVGIIVYHRNFHEKIEIKIKILS